MTKTFAILGGIFGFLAVAAGAFGAHALASKLDDRALELWNLAARYQLAHALALFAAAWLWSETHSSSATVGGWAFVLGIVVFGGSLYALALTGAKWLGAITPIGGVALLVGWGACIWAATRLA